MGLLLQVLEVNYKHLAFMVRGLPCFAQWRGSSPVNATEARLMWATTPKGRTANKTRGRFAN